MTVHKRKIPLTGESYSSGNSIVLVPFACFDRKLYCFSASREHWDQRQIRRHSFKSINITVSVIIKGSRNWLEALESQQSSCCEIIWHCSWFSSVVWPNTWISPWRLARLARPETKHVESDQISLSGEAARSVNPGTWILATFSSKRALFQRVAYRNNKEIIGRRYLNCESTKIYIIVLNQTGVLARPLNSKDLKKARRIFWRTDL